MKNKLCNLTVATHCLILFSGQLTGQDEIRFERISKNKMVFGKNIVENFGQANRPSNVTKTVNKKAIPDLSKCKSSQVLDVIDTLNYPLIGTYGLYISDQGGYVTGNNEYGDIAKANYFEISEAVYLTGIIFDFYLAKGGNPAIEIVVWDHTGANQSPGNVIGTSSVNLDILKNDIANNQMSYIPFDPPVLITSAFYAGIVLPAVAGDTLVIWSNTDGDTNPGTAWEKWSDNTWHSMSSNETWGLDLALAVFPVVSIDVPLTAIFSADFTTIQVGQTINFQDLSIGNPTTWEWIFEGGSPAVSSEQNPVVTYNEAGSFDVTLMVSDDTTSDTKTIPDYIIVSSSSIVIDTLNYPFTGTYSVYYADGVGFVSGNNSYGDLAKANYFFNNQNRDITGVLIEFAYATGGNPSIELAVWNNSGSGGSPGTKIGNQYLTLNTIKNDINNEQMTFVSFNPPINVTSSFYAGFILPASAGDTLVVWSNEDGETDPGTAWELWIDNQWYNFNDPASWVLDVSLAVFPVMQSSLGFDETDFGKTINIFPNPSTGLYYLTFDPADSPLSVSIFKVDGTLLKTENIHPAEIFSIDLTGYPSGIYFMKLFCREGTLIQKLVKQ